MQHAKTENFPALTGLRAVLATLVVLFHCDDFLDLGPLQTFVASGGSAVDVFFILSGFILGHTYYDSFAIAVSPPMYIGFLQNRLARIYPVHVMMLVAFLATYLTSERLFHFVPHDIDLVQARSLAANLLLVQAWFQGIGVGSPNQPSWSISAEWFAYLFCPFMILLFRRANTNWLAILLVVALLLRNMFEYTPWHTDLRLEWVSGVASLVRISGAFTVGTIVYFLNRRFGLADCLPRWTAAAVCIALIANFYVFDGGSYALHLALSSVLILSLTKLETSALIRMLSTKSAVYLGEVSYSLYMCHWLVMLLLIHAVHWHAGRSFVLWASVPVVSQVVAIVTYHFIEVPGRRLIRKSVWVTTAAYSRGGMGSS
jgi:peptidoglycan/LPS O-acetylase OafA/YrhL